MLIIFPKPLVVCKRFFCVTLSTLLITSLFLIGCGEAESPPEIATVKIEFTLPNTPVPSDVDGPICKKGDILQPGESCFYPGTGFAFSVYEDWAQFMFVTVGEGLTLSDSYINGTLFNLIAHKRNDNSWIIEDVGYSGKLDVIVSTDTKQEFALTESFSQDFSLDPDNPSLTLTITNNTPHDLSVDITVLFDGEVVIDERDSFTPRSTATWRRTRSTVTDL